MGAEQLSGPAKCLRHMVMLAEQVPWAGVAVPSGVLLVRAECVLCARIRTRM